MTESTQIANAMEEMIGGRTLIIPLDGQPAKLTIQINYPYSASDKEWDRLNMAVLDITEYAKKKLGI